MKIAVDIDDVLGDYHHSMLRFLADIKGVHLTREDCKEFHIQANFGETPEYGIALHVEYADSDYIREMPILDGAFEAVTRLSKNHELIAVTARETALRKLTNQFIEQFQGKISDVYYTLDSDSGTQHTKGEICVREGVDIMIEDAIHHAETVAANGVQVLLLDCPWNQAVALPHLVTRVQDWEEVVSIVEDINILKNPRM